MSDEPFGRSACLVPGVTTCAALRPAAPAEHYEVDQRIRAETVGAVYRDASRLADRHQAGHDHVGIAVGLHEHLAVIVRGDAAHVVMHRRQHRDRLFGEVDAGEDAGGLGDAR